MPPLFVYQIAIRTRNIHDYNYNIWEWRCRVKDQLLDTNDINLVQLAGVTKRLQIVRFNDNKFWCSDSCYNDCLSQDLSYDNGYLNARKHERFTNQIAEASSQLRLSRFWMICFYVQVERWAAAAGRCAGRTSTRRCIPG